MRIKLTERFKLSRYVYGLFGLKSAWEDAAPKIDAHLVPPYTADDIGKTLGVVQGENGEPTLAWIGS